MVYITNTDSRGLLHDFDEVFAYHNPAHKESTASLSTMSRLKLLWKTVALPSKSMITRVPYIGRNVPRSSASSG